MPNDRAAVAREVLTELAETMGREFNGGGGRVLRFRDEHYPAPPAPETVTVKNTWTRKPAGYFTDRVGNSTPFSDEWADALHRIASDARELGEKDARIAELEKECVRLHGYIDVAQSEREKAWEERDAALRALEEKGTGLGTPMPKSEATDSVADAPTSPVSPSPAPTRSSEPRSAATPIPLGATLHVPGDPDSPYERVSGGWIRECTPRATRVQRLEKVYRDDDAAWGNILTRYYHARHPVATRETVERVAEAQWGAWASYDERQVQPFGKQSREIRSDWMHIARAALSAAGFTLEGNS